MDIFCNLVVESAFDSKAEKLVVIDISSVSLMADYILICNGRSKANNQGIANTILEKMKKTDNKVFGIEGMSEGDWVLLDLGNVIVHIMTEELREYYTLEKLWGNGKVVALDEVKVESAQAI